MAKKVNQSDSSMLEVKFIGGPADGRLLRMDKYMMPPRVRFAFPEWCNYYRVGDSFVYEWKDIPWVPVPFVWALGKKS